MLYGHATTRRSSVVATSLLAPMPKVEYPQTLCHLLLAMRDLVGSRLSEHKGNPDRGYHDRDDLLAALGFGHDLNVPEVLPV